MKVVLITAPPEEAGGLARRAVEADLAACINLVRGVTSHYRWEGRVQADEESLLIAKVSDDRVEEFVRRVRGWHSYECPEIVVLPVTGGNPDYLAWVEAGSRD